MCPHFSVSTSPIPAQAKVAAMKLRKPEAWGRTPQVNEEEPQIVLLVSLRDRDR